VPANGILGGKYPVRMKKLFVTLALLVVFWACRQPPEEDTDFLKNLLARDTALAAVLAHADSLEVQIIYTMIDRDTANRPTFRTFYYNVDSSHYFYPASTVKLPTVMLALEKLRALNIDSLDMFTPMFHDSVYAGQLSVVRDSTARSGLPSVEHYMKKILIVSDNDAYNRLYEFVGQKALNERLRQLGYKQTRMLHRLERPLSRNENAHTEAVRFEKRGQVVYQQPMLVNEPLMEVRDNVLRGKGFMRNDSLIQQPFDFTYKNFFPLTEQHVMLRAILFPETVPPSRRFAITDEDRARVLEYMSQLPTETYDPPYATDTTYYDAYCKFLMFGSRREGMPHSIRIFNKVGDAYGYLIDNAYIVNFDTGVEFMVSAVINTNTDGIYNDGKYDYETLGFPFLKRLGEVLYQYEREERKRNVVPNFSGFKFDYSDKNK
jgi:hypothetical protein